MNLTTSSCPFSLASRTRRTAPLLAGLLAVAGLASAAGCDAPEPQAGQATSDAVAAAPTQVEVFADRIARHPLFAPLSQKANAELSGAAHALAGRPITKVQADVALLEKCVQTGDVAPCMPTVLVLGLTTSALAEDQARARQIAADVGLTGASVATIEAAFRGAEWTVNGSGAAHPLGQQMAATPFVWTPRLPCDASCVESLGNSLGSAKAAYLAKQSLPQTPVGLGTASVLAEGDDGDGATIGVVIAVATAVISVAKQLEEWIWNSNEEDKECEHDSDCLSTEFCHKIGDNDCRPSKDEGSLCDRAAQCDSNCCKPHISTGFLLSCRPKDKCD